jgi:hypothetical protein
VSATAPLMLCADLANGAKHLKLTSAKTGDQQTSISSQSVSVRPGTVRARQHSTMTAGLPRSRVCQPTVPYRPSIPGRPCGGQEVDLVALADEVVATWTAWLQHPQQHLM